MNRTRPVARLRVTVGDRQVVSLAGLHLVGEVAERVGLPGALSDAMGASGVVHDRGRLLTQVALMLAGGGRCVADMDALREQPEVFGEVASSPTVWRTFTTIDPVTLDAIRRARAIARERAWSLRRAPKTLILDVDASLLEIHSERKEHAASHFKGGYGFHPMLCFADHSGEALAGILRPGNATANSGADQLAVVDLAIDQVPVDYQAGHRPGDKRSAVAHKIVVRADSAGAVRAFVAGLVERNCEFSITARVNAQLDAAIAAVKRRAWRPALDADAKPRTGAQIAELDLVVAGWPAGTRAIVRRERPHPGAQLKLWDRDGYRHQVVLTNSRGDAARLELRHRRHGHVENRIKNLKDTGIERMPFTSFDANAAWMETTLAAADLLVWTQRICFTGELARCEPRTLRYRVLHIAARVVRSARRVELRLPANWPWSRHLLRGYTHLDALRI
jgi:Transposase DDE domain group 1